MVEQPKQRRNGVIEAITIQDDARERHYRVPLLEERERYIEHLIRRGARKNYIRVTASYMERVVELMGLTGTRSITRAEVEEAVVLWSDPCCACRIRPSSKGYSARALKRVAIAWLSFLGDLECAPPPWFEWFIQEFTNALHRQNVGPISVARYGWRVRTFFRFASEKIELRKIALSDIDAFISAKRRLGWTLHSIIGHCRTLKQFFQFAETKGWCEAGFHLGIKIPRAISHRIEPTGPEWKEVLALLKSFRGETAQERRSKPMVMLCALYGLRSTEVTRLELDDIDWRTATFSVRRAKRGGVQHYPLLYEVGQAILEYLKTDRPKSESRLVFLSMRPPYGEVGKTSLWKAIGPYLRSMTNRADYVGAHCLRHACATRLLRRGASLRQIADFLGHRNIRSVDGYAKLDTRSLRTVAAFSLSELL